MSEFLEDIRSMPRNSGEKGCCPQLGVWVLKDAPGVVAPQGIPALKLTGAEKYYFVLNEMYKNLVIFNDALNDFELTISVELCFGGDGWQTVRFPISSIIEYSHTPATISANSGEIAITLTLEPEDNVIDFAKYKQAHGG